MNRKAQKHVGQNFMAPIESASISSGVLHTILGEILLSGQPVTITVTGSSMQPFLRHSKDRVYLLRCDPSEIKRGDIVLYARDDGTWVLHRVYRANGLFTMIGDSQWILEPNIRKDQIMAKALYALRGGKRVSCTYGLRNTMMKLYLYRMRAPRLFHMIADCAALFRSMVKRVG
jgi:hypothetical protein